MPKGVEGRGAGGSFCAIGRGLHGQRWKSLPPFGGQGQVMRARECVGPLGMASVLGSPGSRQLACNPKPE